MKSLITSLFKHPLKIMVSLLALYFGSYSFAQADYMGSYRAFLSERDHFNSSGKRLRNPAAIIRQDRANFHRFGRRDAGDEWDEYLHSTNNRAIVERWLNAGNTPSWVKRRIVNGTPYINVHFYGDGYSVYSISVEVE